MYRRRDRRRKPGQIIVIFAMALAFIVLGAGLVVDVGYAWSQQRHTQNGADAAAKAGALLLAQRSADSSAGITGGMVRNEILTSLTANRLSLEAARYVEFDLSDAGEVVSTSAAPPADAVGVRVAARREVDTFLVGRVVSEWRVVQEATAISGPTNGCVDLLEGCTLLPVTFPVNVFACTNNGKTQPVDPPQSWPVGAEISLPLCGGNPGSVGWIDWSPPAGGTSELAAVISNPPPVNIPLPSWQYITETGDISAKQVEDAINEYVGQVVLVPMFADTCLDEPPDKEDSFCPTGSGTGTGVNQWYFITKFLAFRLASPQGAFIQGGAGNEAICGIPNAMECLKGSFVSFVTEGGVTGPCPSGGCEPGTAFAVQLVR